MEKTPDLLAVAVAVAVAVEGHESCLRSWWKLAQLHVQAVVGTLDCSIYALKVCPAICRYL
jgi:hypothetical protein